MVVGVLKPIPGSVHRVFAATERLTEVGFNGRFDRPTGALLYASNNTLFCGGNNGRLEA